MSTATVTAQSATTKPVRGVAEPTAKVAPLGRRPSLLLGVLAGFLYFLAFPGMDLWPLGFVALVPLIVALRGQPPRRALLIGWSAGLTMTLLGFYWLLDMLQTFSGFPTPICAIFLLLLSAYQGGRMALLGWLSGRGETRGYPFGLVFTLGFITSELVYPLLFPWFYAAVVHQLPVFLQTAELGGPIAVALVLIAINFALAEVVIARRECRPLRPRWIVGLSASALLAVVYGAVRIRQEEARVADAPKGKVGLVQANMSLFGKRHQVQEGMRRHLEMTRKIKSEAAVDLVVWSETSVMGAIWENEANTLIPLRFSRHLQVPTLFGAVLARPVADVRDHVLFNSALITDAKGAVQDRYDKHYLLPFGEFIPFGDQLPILYEWSPNSGHFAKGETIHPLHLGEHEVAVFICYEDVIPHFANAIASSGNPDLLANLTNDAWFGDTTEPWIHLALSEFRAIEHRRFFVRSTNSGVSAVIDPVGRIVAHTETFQEATLTVPIAWLRGKTPYELWGDGPWWLAALFSVICAIVPLAAVRQRLGRTAHRPGDRTVTSNLSSTELDSEIARFRLASHRRLRRNAARRPD